MSRFVNTLRAAGPTIRLAEADSASVWTVRAQCADVWDAVRLDVTADTRVRDVKQAAMTRLLPDADVLDDFVVKVHGIEVLDEGRSVQGVGATDGSTLLIVSRRRRAVR